MSTDVQVIECKPDHDPWAAGTKGHPTWCAIYRTCHNPATRAWARFLSVVTGVSAQDIDTIAQELDVRYRIEPEGGIGHSGNVRWDEAPIPKRWHKCFPQTTSGEYGMGAARCACGAVKFSIFGRWSEKNSRRKSERKARQ